MNKQDLKFQARQNIARLENSVLRVIAAFPTEKLNKDNNIVPVIWKMKHVRVAVKELVENPELSTEQVIKGIKRSWACHGENWYIDAGKEYIPLTQEEEDFNNARKQR